MPIDPSIPLQAQAPQQGGLGSILGTLNDALKLRTASQQLAANQAISQAYSQSVNPDGSVDFSKLQSLAAQNGAGAFLPQFMGQIAQQRNQQLQYDSGKLELALKQQSDIRNRIGSLMADPGFGKSDMSNAIVNTVTDAVQAGSLPMDQALRELKAIPSDPTQQAQWIQQHFLNSLSGEAKIQAMLPKTQVINTGGQSQIVNTNPLTGQPSMAGSLTNTPTPDTMVGNVNAVTPQGVPYQITKAQQLAGVASPQGGVYTGRYGASQPNGLPAGAIQTGLSPGQQTALTAQAGTSNAAAQTLHDAAADAPMRINLLNTARDALSNITTGPGTDWRNTFASALQSTPAVGAALQAMGINDPTKIGSYDEYKKILTNYASSISGSLGTGTDARLNAAVTGNANPGISNMANEDILAKTLAAEKMRQAQDYAFQNSGLTTDQFNKWQSQWNKEVNPDAFVFTSMNPQQQKDFIARQTKAGTLNSFKSDLAKLVRSGVISMPGGQ